MPQPMNSIYTAADAGWCEPTSRCPGACSSGFKQLSSSSLRSSLLCIGRNHRSLLQAVKARKIISNSITTSTTGPRSVTAMPAHLLPKTSSKFLLNPLLYGQG